MAAMGWFVGLIGAAASLAVSAVAAKSSAKEAASIVEGNEKYDFRDVVPKYCNIEKDWGAIPDKPAGATGLRQVQVFIRHGARTQCSADICWDGDNDEGSGEFSCGLNYLDNSIDSKGQALTESFRTVYLPGRNSLRGDCLTGQLVEAGFEMQVNNGKRLRDAYVTRELFLPVSLDGMTPEALDKDFYFRSTDIPRTKQSGMALISGLYPGIGPTAPYITLRTMDFAQENMLINEKQCPATKAVGQELFKKLPKEVIEEIMTLRILLHPENMEMQAGFWWLQHLVDCLMSRACPTVPFHPHNTTIPEKFLANDNELFRRLWKTVDKVQWSFYQAMSNAGAFGSLASDMLAFVDAAVPGGAAQGPPADARKFVFFSGHDTGPMLPLNAALNLRWLPPYWPSFASMTILELWDTSDGSGIARWVSEGQVVKGPMPIAELRKELKAVADTASRCHEERPTVSLDPTTAGLRYALSLAAGSSISISNNKNTFADFVAPTLGPIALVCAIGLAVWFFRFKQPKKEKSRRNLIDSDAESNNTSE